MYSFAPILLILFFAILLAFAIDRDVTDVIPVFVFSFLICLFALAILKKPHHAFDLSLAGFAAVWILYIARKRRVFPSINDIKSKFTPLPIGLLVYFGVLLVMWYAYSNHVVNNWDDFHYNATFARDLYAYGGMPVGWKSATGYKTYKPLMQMFYNWGFQATGGYDEQLMFRYKSFLVYTACLPLFKKIDVVKGTAKKICIAVMTFILPYLFMYEMVDSLSMDCMMGLLAAYSLCVIVFVKEKDWFYYLRIVVGLTTLVLVKSSAVMFVAICFAVWLITELLEIKKYDKLTIIRHVVIYAGTAAVVLGAWAVWKIFCDINGNETYLNAALNAHLGEKGKLPWYGTETILNGLKSLFTMSLNLGKYGLSFMMVVMVTVLLLVYMYSKKLIEKKDCLVDAAILCAAIPYVMVLLYTYVFVFEEYEALSLSSYDRYVGTYALMILYYALYRLTEYEKVVVQIITSVTCICVLTLNVPYLYNGLVPPVYSQFKAEIISARSEAESEIASLMPEDFIREAGKMLIVSNESQTVYGRGLDYAVIPYVASEVVISEIENDIADELENRFANETVDYVYICNKMSESDVSSCNRFVDGENIKPGTLYKYQKDTGMLEYVADCH